MAQGFHDMSLSMDRQTAVLDQGLANVANAILAPRITETRTNGKSWGGSQTVTNEEYEEHALTEARLHHGRELEHGLGRGLQPRGRLILTSRSRTPARSTRVSCPASSQRLPER